MSSSKLTAVLDDARIAAIMRGPSETRHVELAKLLGRELCGFTEADEKYVEMFWNPAFNGSWLHVTEEMVEQRMGYKPSKDMMKDFYVKMKKECVADVDYKQISPEDLLVLTGSGTFPEQKSACVHYDGRGGHNKKHYIITGNAFKDLLQAANTERGRATRAYYRKVEQLCALTTRALLTLAERESERLRGGHRYLLGERQRLLLKERESDEKLEKWRGVASKVAAAYVDMMFATREASEQLEEIRQWRTDRA